MFNEKEKQKEKNVLIKEKRKLISFGIFIIRLCYLGTVRERDSEKSNW